uniref:ATP-binding cassette transporter sub-family H 88708 n=1 Tax=Tigriopus japonicus TaxID=158387 RepID=A0A0A7AS29_TIGJA|nr:ATP-binding cassette transporter sub-family H 88708 [Tigriopus japonicus]
MPSDKKRDNIEGNCFSEAHQHTQNSLTHDQKIEEETCLVEKSPQVISPKRKSPKKTKMVSDPNTAISFENAYKQYGRGSRKVPVLCGLNMTIPKGAIYGLLGPSGCGKTTLLSCIVGKQRLKSGSVTVFGGKPGSAESGVPGTRAGYMPQELALYGEFTIAETMQYFGRVYDLTAAKIRERTEFLLNFLDLPKERRLIMNLSGGQQRRASLAAALLHEPELLILDEPTVGVDPLLRQCIWTHLLEISKASHLQTTIVITTHYIEEARQANVVGMMRFGKLLAEGSPAKLLELYHMPNLEDVFLHLCLGDEEQRETENANKLQDIESPKSVASPVKVDNDFHVPEVQVETEGREPRQERGQTNNWCTFLTPHRMRALLAKNFIRMWRNIGFLIFQFIIPTVQVALFCLAIGRDPRDLTLAVVNEDVPSMRCPRFTTGCILGEKDDFLGAYDFNMEHRANLSCRYLSYIDEAIIRPKFFDSLEEAELAAKRGQHWGVMHFKQNYTLALFERLFGLALANPEKLTNETLDLSEIHVSLDMTNQQVGYTIQLRLSEAYEKFAQSLLNSCNFPKELASLPIAFEEPIYGSNEPTFTEFMAPGVILSITYFMAVGLTALSFIIERKEGLLDRSWVAGVTATEVMLAHVVAQFVVMVVQVALVLVFMIYVFNVPAEGPLIWIILLTIFQGICGMSFGLVISAVCDNEQDAIQLALGSFYPNLLLSGIIWPLEGMPEGLRYLSYILPQTYACEAMRGILSRGWGIEWMQVYRGYLVTFAWTIFMLILSAVLLKIRR